MKLRVPFYKCHRCGTDFPWIPGILNSTRGVWPDFYKKPKCSFCGNHEKNEPIIENWERALKLEEYIRFYTPKNFKEPIHEFSYSSYILEEDYIKFEEDYKSGILRSILEAKDSRFNKPYLVEAILDYFNKENTK